MQGNRVREQEQGHRKQEQNNSRNSQQEQIQQEQIIELQIQEQVRTQIQQTQVRQQLRLQFRLCPEHVPRTPFQHCFQHCFNLQATPPFYPMPLGFSPSPQRQAPSALSAEGERNDLALKLRTCGASNAFSKEELKSAVFSPAATLRRFTMRHPPTRNAGYQFFESLRKTEDIKVKARLIPFML